MFFLDRNGAQVIIGLGESRISLNVMGFDISGNSRFGQRKG